MAREEGGKKKNETLKITWLRNNIISS